MRRLLLRVSAIVVMSVTHHGTLGAALAALPEDVPRLKIPSAPPVSLCNELEDRWDFDALAETTSRFKKLLDDAVRTGDKACELEAMTQLARIKGLEKDFSSADEILTGVASRLEPAMVSPL